MPASTIPSGVLIVGAIAIAVAFLLVGLIAMKARSVDLTRPSDQKPEWMRNTPPAESVAAEKATGSGTQVYDRAPGEALASPFAEQIEDILRAKLAADPQLKHYRIDLGTAADGSLEISVDGGKFVGIEALPDARLKALFQQSVEAWKKG